jgi:hypothetical protein
VVSKYFAKFTQHSMKKQSFSYPFSEKLPLKHLLTTPMNYSRMVTIQKHILNSSRHISRKELQRLMAFSASGSVVRNIGRPIRVATRQHAAESTGGGEWGKRRLPGPEKNTIQIPITTTPFDVMSRFNA